MIYDERFVRKKQRELVDTLFGLSLPAESQMEVVGPPFPGEELTIDFYSAFSDMRKNFEHYDILSTDAVDALVAIESKLTHMQDTLDSSVFLDSEKLRLCDAWEEVRKLASKGLIAMEVNPSDLIAEVESEHCGGLILHKWKTLSVDAEQAVPPKSDRAGG